MTSCVFIVAKVLDSKRLFVLALDFVHVYRHNDCIILKYRLLNLESHGLFLLFWSLALKHSENLKIKWLKS